jgi:hypothetical protein
MYCGENSMKITNIFAVATAIEIHGIWYTIWFYGWRNAWTIWVASRMVARDERTRDWLQN